MSALLHFDSEDQRSDFLRVIRDERSDILPRIKPTFSQPTIIARTTSPEQERWLRQRIVGFGHFQPDEPVQLFGS
jgi:hypothetical protein